MADDVVALLDTLHIAKTDVVGWSDGAILGLDLAVRHPDHIAVPGCRRRQTSPSSPA
jgi:pimeloyl-ACP methyl ester carboxylesterase